jgi:hypothetical protein
MNLEELTVGGRGVGLEVGGFCKEATYLNNSKWIIDVSSQSFIVNNSSKEKIIDYIKSVRFLQPLI